MEMDCLEECELTSLCEKSPSRGCRSSPQLWGTEGSLCPEPMLGRGGGTDELNDLEVPKIP